VLLSAFTKAWQLYLGVFFILIVMYAPDGIAGILMRNLRLVEFGKFGRVWPALWKLCLAALLGFAGLAMGVEMLYRLSLEAAEGSAMQLFGIAFDSGRPGPWAIVLIMLTTGGLAFRAMRDGFVKVWGEVNAEIEEQIRKDAA
jgi:branched-chain amino acid transport system permease protein